MRAGRGVWAAAMIVFLALGVGLRAQESEEKLSPARENPLLRTHFERQYRSVGSALPLNRIFLNQYVDRQIDRFVEQLHRQRADLEDSFQLLLDVREEWMEASVLTPDFRQRWRRNLDEVADKAGSLRRSLAYVFIELRSGGDRPTAASENQDSGYAPEFDYIGAQIERALRQIDNYFFRFDNTVHVEDIQGENMLVNLRQVEEMAKALRDLL